MEPPEGAMRTRTESVPHASSCTSGVGAADAAITTIKTTTTCIPLIPGCGRERKRCIRCKGRVGANRENYRELAGDLSRSTYPNTASESTTWYAF